MQFDSFLFILFFAAVCGIYYLLRSWRSQKALLLIASYLFYGAWSPPLVILIWASTLVDFFVAKRLHVTTGQRHRRALLLLSVCTNLGLLGYFKYAEFLLTTFSDLLNAGGILYRAPALDILLPIGISFYTFQTLSYTIDVYRRKFAPTESLLDFSLYVTFFPQLVAGPIVRADHFLPQCETPRRAGVDAFSWGATLLIFGVFSKTVLSDTALAPIVDQVYANPASFAWYDAWISVLAFSGQIFFDFSGYSICAIGAAMCFGFTLPDNFHSPYGAAGFSDFWRRWHISLSSWLRDYLFISLGGSRKGIGRTLRNVAITMILGGLWHGAAWTFALWGVLHGIFLVVEHAFRDTVDNLARRPGTRLLLILATFLIVTLTWIPFRSSDLANLAAMFAALTGGGQGSETIVPAFRVAGLAIVGLLVVAHIRLRDTHLEQHIQTMSITARSSLIALLLITTAVCSSGDSRAFIYFQF